MNSQRKPIKPENLPGKEVSDVEDLPDEPDIDQIKQPDHRVTEIFSKYLIFQKIRRRSLNPAW